MAFDRSQQQKTSEKIFLNEAIRVPQVLCIGADGTKYGVISTQEARRMAGDAGLDLLQVSPPRGGQPPTCKIIDYGKYKYDESIKKKISDKKQRESAVELKEIKFRPATSDHDLQIKAKKALEFLNGGCQVKISVVFLNKRETTLSEVAVVAIDQFMSFLPEAEMVSNPFRGNKLDLSQLVGKSVSVMIRKKKDDR